jgi:hypothetical protein
MDHLLVVEIGKATGRLSQGLAAVPGGLSPSVAARPFDTV